MKGKLIKSEHHGYILEDYEGNLLATISDNDSIYKLSIKNCQAIFNGYDLEHICWQLFGGSFEARSVESEEEADRVVNFGIECFQKALEILGDKKFSKADVREAIDIAWFDDNIDKSTIIQSLQQTEIEVEIEMEDAFVKNDDQYIDEVGVGNYSTHSKKPKLDADGCLILKRKV